MLKDDFQIFLYWSWVSPSLSSC